MGWFLMEDHEYKVFRQKSKDVITWCFGWSSGWPATTCKLTVHGAMVGTSSSEAESLLSESDATCCCGLKRDVTQWIQWRGPNGGLGNRLSYQCICSVLLLLEMILYFMCVKQSRVLCLIGGFFVIKALIEIWGQQTPTWMCPGTLCLVVVVYTLGLPTVVVYMYGYCTITSDINFEGRDMVALALYFGGSLYSLAYEVDRFRWKAKPENKGKLHTVGLATWCIHPNYFGDLFTYTGWALASGTLCAISIPILTIWTFVLFVVPNSDHYLAERYPNEFPAYAEKTATLIPGLRSSAASKILAWICLTISIYLWCYACPSPCGY